MITTFILAAAIAVTPDAWEIKPNFAEGSKTVIAMNVNASVDGSDHTAKMNVIRTCGATASDKTIKAKFAWDGLEVDGNSMEAGDNSWDVVMTPDGAILSTSGEGGDDIRRMLSATNFIYPSKPVGPGDKWESTVKPNKDKDDRALTWSYEVKGVEKVKDVEALKVSATLTEKGADGMTADGSWWVAKNGSILKFEVKLKKWVVPMSNGGPIDATISGEAVPAK